MIEIDERIPEHPLHAQVVLHVRRHLRRSIRRRTASAVDDLAMLFGLASEQGQEIRLAGALKQSDSIYRAAELIAATRSAKTRVVAMGHDEAHVTQCWKWLSERKNGEPVFQQILATDLHTLLVLSEALDLATAATPDGERGSRLVPILIEGGTGTGKDMLAKAIHAISFRANKTQADRFEVVNVSGLSSDFVNDELFGHVKGGFTGALADRKGRLEEADGGTLLIDEVGDLSLDAQVRLLRFLQDQVFSKVGDNKVVNLNVRVIAATWHNLDVLIKEHKFRLDLLHRLRVGHLKLPPLKDRPEVFKEVVPAILTSLGHKSLPAITRSATDALALYDWPGNLRELNGVLRIAESSAEGDIVRLENLPHHLQHRYLTQPAPVRAPGLLCDELDETSFSAEQVSIRVSRVTDELERMPAPDANPNDVAIRDFLMSVPDNSVEHRTVIEQVNDVLTRGRERDRIQVMLSAWSYIYRAGLPAPVAHAVKTKLEGLQAQLDRAAAAVHVANEDLPLQSSPWIKIFSDAAQLPSFQGRDLSDLRKGVIEALKLIHTIVPEFGERINAIMKTGGLTGLREEARRILLDAHEENSGTTDEPEFDHKQLSPDGWAELVGAFSSKAKAAEAKNVSDKTISKYLKKYGIQETWGTKPSYSLPGDNAAAGEAPPDKSS